MKSSPLQCCMVPRTCIYNCLCFWFSCLFSASVFICFLSSSFYQSSFSRFKIYAMQNVTFIFPLLFVLSVCFELI
jgi:hypothetical protein